MKSEEPDHLDLARGTVDVVALRRLLQLEVRALI
jgi:hypothetical protein